MDWFLYDIDLRHERVNRLTSTTVYMVYSRVPAPHSSKSILQQYLTARPEELHFALTQASLQAHK